MPRYRLTIEYDGTDFVGWQRQQNGLGVQQVLEEAVLGFSGETVNVYGAGRTDTGVHAVGQVAHIDLVADHTTDTVRDAINFHVKPHPIAVLEAVIVDEDFHARFSAKQRIYEYHVVDRRPPLALKRHHAWWVPMSLDESAMHAAAQTLVGRHDFTSFRAVACQAKSPEKTLDSLDVTREGETIVVTARARSFLHHQVRNMVGTLKLVGEGKWSASDVARALEARDRGTAGPTVPPCGLYLCDVVY